MKEVIELLEKELQRNKSLKEIFENQQQRNDNNPNILVVIEFYQNSIEQLKKSYERRI